MDHSGRLNIVLVQEILDSLETVKNVDRYFLIGLYNFLFL
jgi:hypothetical protein